MKTKKWLLAGCLSVCMLAGGCDIGTNPIIFDGSPAEAVFEVSSPIASFAPIVYSVDLQEVLSNISGAVDSIRIYNITLRVVDSIGNAPSATGTITVNGNTLVSLNGTPLPAFAAERTIFDPGLAPLGFAYSATIVPTLNGYLARNPRPRVDVVASGTTNRAPIRFTVRVKFYTQVFLSP